MRVSSAAAAAFAQPSGETFRAAEAAYAYFAGREPGTGDAPRERRDNADFALYEDFGELPRFAGPAEDEDHERRPYPTASRHRSRVRRLASVSAQVSSGACRSSTCAAT
jgi:hypothetical protein